MKHNHCDLVVYILTLVSVFNKNYVYIKYLIQSSIKYRRLSSVDIIVLLSTT